MATGKHVTRARAKVVREAKSEPISVARSLSAGFAVGDQVTHKLFGDGKIVGIRDDALTIRFGKTGIKEIRADFVVAG